MSVCLGCGLGVCWVMDIYDGQVDSEQFVRETLSMSENRHLRLKYFAIIFGVLNLLLLVIVLTASYVEMKGVKDKLKTSVNDELYSAKLMMSIKLKDALNDLFFLSDIIDQEYEHDTRNVQSAIRMIMYSFMRNNDSYDQTRLLDTDGMEVIRVNQGTGNVPYVVPDDELQDKSDRYYFSESIALTTSVAYISKLDLNVERGKIEIPYKLVVRMSTPIYSEGILHGVLVLNFLGSELLSDAVHILKRGDEHSGDEYFLLNSNGDPLAYIKWVGDSIGESLLGYDAATAYEDTFSPNSENILRKSDGVYEQNDIIFSKTTIRVDSTASNTNKKYDLVKVNVLPYDDIDDSDLILLSVTCGVKYLDIAGEFVARNALPLSWIEIIFIFITSVASVSLVKQEVLENAIKSAAAFDPLTSVYNRRFGVLLLKYEMKKIARTHEAMTMFVIDVNNLKKVNDGCGHNSGDMLLKVVASRLKSAVREYDIVCRIGGDEFILAFSGLDLPSSTRIVERVRLGLNAEFKNEFRGVGADFSYGGVEYDPATYRSFEEFMRKADEYMYEDKKRRKQGRA